MEFGSDDLAPLLAAASRESNAGAIFGQGIVKSWDRLTGQNTVEYRGALLRNLPILGTLESLLLNPGDVVGILGFRTSYFIAGRITPPNSTGYGDALEAIRDAEASDTANVTTLSTSFVSLTGGPTLSGDTAVLVGPSGRVEVKLSAWLSVATNGSGGNQQSAIYSFEMKDATGSVVRSPADVRAVSLTLGGGSTGAISAGVAATRSVVVIGLTPGLHSLEAKYRCADAAQLSAGFTNRVLAAVAL